MQKSKTTERSVAEVAEQVLHRLHIVDVREPYETIGELGHIPGAENVPFAHLADAVAGWARDRAIVVVDRDGQLAPRALAVFAGLGFTDVSVLRGGMVAWREARLPAGFLPPEDSN